MTKAIILAAGSGSRLKQLNTPKCLITVGGKTLLEWQVEALIQGGVRDIAIVTGYKGNMITHPSMKEYFKNEKWEQTNMVYSLLYAKKWLEQYDCIVSYADIIFESSVILKTCECNYNLVLPYNTRWLSLWKKRFNDPLIDAETFILDAKGTLLEIGKKATDLSQIQGQYMGLIKFTPRGWQEISHFLLKQNTEVVDKLDMTSLLNKLITSGVEINTVPIDGNWFEIDNEKDIELCKSYFDKGLIKSI